MPAYRIGKRERRSLGIPVPEEPLRKRTGTAQKRRVKKVAKRRAGRAVPQDVDDADHAVVRDVPDAVVEDAPEETAAEDGPEGAVENVPIPMVEDALEGAPAADDDSEHAVEGASEKRDKGTVAPRARQPSDEKSHPAVEPKTKTAVANSSDAMPEPPASLSKLGIPVDTWRRLEEVSRKTLPRFLFRCFDERSGGRIGLNTKDGITPLGFLEEKKPTNMYDIEDLRNMVDDHLAGGTSIKTEFSSWSADFAFTSEMNFDVIRGLFFPKSATTGKITEEHVVAAKNTATFFRRPEDGRPDIVIAMTAAFLVLQDRWGESEVLSDSAWGLIQTHLAEEFKAVRLPGCRPDAVGLANPNTHTTNLPKLRQTINLLMTIEARLKALRRAQMQQLVARPCKARTGDSSEVPENEKDSIVEAGG
ncbi:hypothetical protein DL767_010498 [Monosporascus sp. MG133]|nr:hypothetical protein DL767_010498 [Monosporascus sp. MG133]